MIRRHLLILALAGILFAQFARAEVVFVQTSNGPFKMYEQSHALLIGNAEYEAKSWDDLGAIPRDIKIVGDELRRQGFSIKPEMNLKADKLPSVIKAFLSADYPRDTRLLIYYSGHGWSEPDGTLGYIVPVDAPADSDPNFRSTLVSMQDIRAAMERPRAAKHVLFVFDSCFAGTIFTTKSTSKPNEAVVSSIDKAGRQFITSGSAGQRVPAESLFAPALILGIGGQADLTKDGIVTGSELGIWLKDELGSDALTPQWGTMPLPYNAGDFVFQVTSLNTPLPMSPMALSTLQTDIPPTAKMEVVAVESGMATVSSGGASACSTQVQQVCIRPKSGGRLLPDTAQFTIETYSGSVLSEGGTVDKSPVTNIGWWIPPNPSPERQFCVRLYARTSACESQVAISGRLSVFEEFRSEAEPESTVVSPVEVTPHFPTIVYFENSADGQRVTDALEGRKYPYERQVGDAGKTTNALTCTPDVPIEFVKEFATDLLDSGVGLKTIYEADSRRTNRLSLEYNPDVEDWPSLTAKRISRMTSCPKFGELRPDLITVTNACASRTPVDVSVEVLDAVSGTWIRTVVPSLGYNKTQVVRSNAGLGEPLQTDYDTIYVTPLLMGDSQDPEPDNLFATDERLEFVGTNKIVLSCDKAP